jgi:hypothetical protein
MLANPEESADVIVLTNWLIAVETSPVVQQNPVAIRKEAPQYSAASHISARSATT